MSHWKQPMSCSAAMQICSSWTPSTLAGAWRSRRTCRQQRRPCAPMLSLMRAATSSCTPPSWASRQVVSPSPCTPCMLCCPVVATCLLPPPPLPPGGAGGIERGSQPVLLLTPFPPGPSSSQAPSHPLGDINPTLHVQGPHHLGPRTEGDCIVLVL